MKTQSGLIKLLFRNTQYGFYTKINEFIKEINKVQEKRKEEIFDKKKFLEELKKEREEYDKDFEERRAAYDFADKQQIRQMNITLAKFDYQKLVLQNINLIPKESFSYPSEIFYFLKQANTQLTVDNIIICIKGMLYCYQQDQEIDIESEDFQSLVQIVEQGVLLTQDIQSLCLFSQFGDSFTITNEQFWVNLQTQINQNISNKSIDIVLPILMQSQIYIQSILNLQTQQQLCKSERRK